MSDSNHLLHDIDHCKALQGLYGHLPNNEYYRPVMQCSPGHAEVSIEVQKKMFHVANAVHGSVYFKLLDDAAFFSAATQDNQYFILTVSFLTNILRPISEGRMIARGKTVHVGKRLLLAQSEVVDEKGHVLALGQGSFMRSQILLSSLDNYKNHPALN